MGPIWAGRAVMHVFRMPSMNFGILAGGAGADAGTSHKIKSVILSQKASNLFQVSKCLIYATQRPHSHAPLGWTEPVAALTDWH